MATALRILWKSRKQLAAAAAAITTTTKTTTGATSCTCRKLEHGLATEQKTARVTLQQHIRTWLKIDEIFVVRRVHQVKALAGGHLTQMARETNVKYPRRRCVQPLLTDTRVADGARSVSLRTGGGGGGVARIAATGAAGERAVSTGRAFAAAELPCDAVAAHDKCHSVISWDFFPFFSHARTVGVCLQRVKTPE